jgi:hypothetical protein
VICIAATMKSRKLNESSVFSEVRDSTLLPHNGVRGQPGRRLLGGDRGIGDRGVDVLDGDRADPRDVELLQVADDHAGVLAGDVAEDHVALRLLRGGVEVDHVDHGRRGAEQLERLVRGLLRGHDPQVDHETAAVAAKRLSPARTAAGISHFSWLSGST